MGKKPFVLVVCDGWGEITETKGNAIAAAKTPYVDDLRQKWPHTTVQASGEYVGLPEGQQGNSEVGHLTIGAGRVIHQDLGLQRHAIKSGTFFQNEILISAIELAKQRGTDLHIMGLVSPGGVHSHQDSAVAVARLAKELNLERVHIHAFTDGRDTPPTSAREHLQKFQQDLDEVGVGRIASVAGRYYAMDRDQRWDRIEHVYQMLTSDEHPAHISAVDYIEERYQDGESDEFLKPIRIANNSEDHVRLKDGDVVIFFNFRPDRARQLSHALIDADFADFERKRIVKDLHLVTFAEYDKALGSPVAFPKNDVNNTLAEVISDQGLKQFHVAETEKYAHVTYFINGGREAAFTGEERLMIPSPKVATYDEKPDMSAQEITGAVLERLENDDDDLIIVNFANADMVGHTGDFASTVQAIEIVDECLGKIAEATVRKGGQLLITADHGNAEAEIDLADGSPLTSHSSNPVPVILCGSEATKIRPNGSLEDIAPTILSLMQLPIPNDMTGTSLVIE
ncbi:MAG: 2,3-bisphosphoglycerate-independent phosphoglycerate mutase [Candidatus Saccharibacteria bacterium]|nr:2,3-bisphosphoglycerate-independent phosphoglycerate mutase [Candidatus Saccharibacteria bacterium]